MKKYFSLILVIVLAFSLAACGKENVDVTTQSATTEASLTDEQIVTRNAIAAFVNLQLPTIEKNRDSAVAQFNEYFANSTDTSVDWAGKLTAALADYDTYMTDLNAINSDDAEFSQLLNLYKSSASAQRDAMSDIVEALVNFDSSMFDAAQDKMNESKDYMVQYETKLKECCDKYMININGDFSMATSSDSDES